MFRTSAARSILPAGPHDLGKGAERAVGDLRSDRWKALGAPRGVVRPPAGECDWHGIACEISPSDGTVVVASLDLMQNNLHGRIPDEIGWLIHIQKLFLYGNDLTGMLPKPLIQRWLSGALWVDMEAPLLTKVTEIDYEYSASAILCAQHRVVFRSDASAALFTERCRNSSPSDRAAYCEVRKGRIHGEQFAMLAWTLERNGFFGLNGKYQRNITDSVFLSTRVTRDGKVHKVVEYAGGGPLELFVIDAAIEGVSSSLDWSTA